MEATTSFVNHALSFLLLVIQGSQLQSLRELIQRMKTGGGDLREPSWKLVTTHLHCHCSDTYHHSPFVVPENWLLATFLDVGDLIEKNKTKNKDRWHHCPHDLPFQWMKTNKTNVLIYLSLSGSNSYNLVWNNLIGSGLRKEHDKAVCCHPIYLTCTLSTSWEMPGWMSYKLESR